MSSFAITVETPSFRESTPEAIFQTNAARESVLSRLLMLYIGSGLFFMLLPGTFLGVWNLIAISSHRVADSVSPAWIQAHGHAQIFGWIGSFILGIGFYSIPKLRGSNFRLWLSAIAWGLWTSGVPLRWLANVYLWHWRVLLPLSATLELAAFLMFSRAVSGHRPPDSLNRQLDGWIFVVIAGTVGLLITLSLNLILAIYLALRGGSPAIPPGLDQSFLVLEAWGFLVPFVWGFSAKWLPVFLGLRSVRRRTLWAAVVMNSVGILAAFFHLAKLSAVLLLTGVGLANYALNVFRRAERPAKIKGIHHRFPTFVRMAYGWALIAASLGVWAAAAGNAHGVAGASRHALTVGFLAMMVFAIGQRILPAFAGSRPLFSARLMFAAMGLLTVGCTLRVCAEILAYQRFLPTAWTWLPFSALTEMCAVTAFAANLLFTFAVKRRPL